VNFPGLVWSTYTANSVVGICTLCDGERWVSVTAGGEVGLWRGSEPVGCWNHPSSRRGVIPNSLR
jgi:hypothetical protein